MVGLTDPARALEVALSAAALVERPDWGRLLGTGPDLLDLLHRLSTADLKGLGPGEGRPAVLTSPKGRIVEAISVHSLGGDGVLILCGPAGAGRALAHVARYTFSERTGLTDLTGATARFAIVGPGWREAGDAAALPPLPPYGATRVGIEGAEATVVRTDGFDADGLTVVVPAGGADAMRARLAAAAGGAVLDAGTAEAWRILSGHPLSGRELTEEHNPLEAGLRDSVSFTKGCYVGQEVVARLNTYGKIARGVVRLEIAGVGDPPPPGSRLLHGGREVGAVTSAAAVPGRNVAAALAYVRWRDLPEDADTVSVEDALGTREATIHRLR